jgi:hypothetical protein
MQTIGNIVTAPTKTISGNTSSLSLPATMDDYNSRYYNTDQMLGGSPYNDYNAYGGIDQVYIPYLSPEEAVQLKDLETEVGGRVFKLAPVIEGKLRRLNPYASDEDIKTRTYNAIAAMHTLMLTHANNLRKRHELLEAVQKGNVSNFTPEQIQQLQQMGVLDKNGQLVPGAHASEQSSMSGSFDDDKNLYPTVFTIASSAKPSEYHKQAIASRSARTGVFDTGMNAPAFVPMYGATPPPPVAGVQAHVSQQGSLSAGLSQPQTINIGNPAHRPGSQTTTVSVGPTTAGFSITNPSAQTQLHPDKIATGEQSPVLAAAGVVHNNKQILPDLLFGSWALTHDGRPGAYARAPYSKQQIVDIADRISKNKYSTQQDVEKDLDVLSKFVGADGWEDLRKKLIGANVSIDINAIGHLSNFLTQLLATSNTPQGDEKVVLDLKQDLANIFGQQQHDPAQLFASYLKNLRQTASQKDKQGAEALYKLAMIAAYDPGLGKALISDTNKGAPGKKTGGDLADANTHVATMTRSAWKKIYTDQNTQYLYNNPTWQNNYAGVHARDITLGVIANAIMRWYDKLP